MIEIRQHNEEKQHMDHPRPMHAMSILVLISGWLLMSAGIRAAEPLGLISLESHSDAQVAEAILGSAHVRSGNRFLVFANPAQQAMLSGEGLEFELLMDEVDPHEVYRVYSLDHRRAPEPVDVRLLGEPIDLGRGLTIMKLTRATAASISDVGKMQATSLADLNIRFLYLPLAVPAAIADDYPSDSLASRVNQDSLLAYVQRLQDFLTRFTWADSCHAARDWIIDRFLSWGYTDVSTQGFYAAAWWEAGAQYNAIVVKPGYAEPDKVIVIGGHYDSMVSDGPYPRSYYDYAPGADDNASGVALTMEIARVLADVPLRKTVIFIAFAAEELGLLGSEYAASVFAAEGTKLEVMYNYDMIGYAEESFWGLDISSGAMTAYRDLSIAAAGRVTGLLTSTNPLPPQYTSDHASFEQQGFHWVYQAEPHLNPYAHTHNDVTSQLDFEFLTDVTRMAAVSLATLADSPYPSEIEHIADPGDGQSLQVSWSDCSSDCSYTLYWGTESETYTDSTEVAAGECTGTITGLNDGGEYHVLAIGELPNGLRAMYGIEGTGVPLIVPRQPQSLSGLATPNQQLLSLTWDANEELDISNYNVYRRIGDIGVFALHETEVPATEYVDYDVVRQVGYEYQITAVDHGGYESEPSESILLYPATFDGGLVFADAFIQDHFYDPDQAEQEAWLDTVLGGVGFSVASSDEHGGPITLNGVGSYSSLFWIDDDFIIKNIAASEPVLEVFAENNTNMLICGWLTWVDWSPQSVPASHLLYREFGLSYYACTGHFDFVGTHGQNGWPSVQIDPTRGMREWRDIPKLTPRPGATVIGTFDSFMDLPDWEGQPVGLAYETATGKRVLLSFPLYYLTPTSAQALMAKVLEYFGMPSQQLKGDLDRSGTIGAGDLTVLLDHLFISLQPLPDPDAADLDGRPGVSLGDAFYLINYLFLGGPAPVPGTR